MELRSAPEAAKQAVQQKDEAVMRLERSVRTRMGERMRVRIRLRMSTQREGELQTGWMERATACRAHH